MALGERVMGAVKNGTEVWAIGAKSEWLECRVVFTHWCYIREDNLNKFTSDTYTSTCR